MQNDPVGFSSLVDGLVNDMYKFATLMHRVSTQSGRQDYLREVEEISELVEIKEELTQRVDAVINQASTLN